MAVEFDDVGVIEGVEYVDFVFEALVLLFEQMGRDLFLVDDLEGIGFFSVFDDFDFTEAFVFGYVFEEGGVFDSDPTVRGHSYA